MRARVRRPRVMLTADWASIRTDSAMKILGAVDAVVHQQGRVLSGVEIQEPPQLLLDAGQIGLKTRTG